MISKDLSQTSNHMADQASRSADHAIDATRNIVGQKVDGLADSMKGLHDQTAPLLDRASEVACIVAGCGGQGVLGVGCVVHY